VVGKVRVANAIGILILYIGKIRFVIICYVKKITMEMEKEKKNDKTRHYWVFFVKDLDLRIVSENI
jgi:hypothetical protein